MTDSQQEQVSKLLQSQLNWYYPDLNENKTEHLLQTRGRVGNFLIRRDHSQPGVYNLCVRRETDIAVIQIYYSGEFYYLHTNEGSMEFAILLDIPYCFAVEGKILKDAAGKAIPITMPFDASNDGNNDVQKNVHSWYQGRMLQSTAEKLLKANASEYCFLIREMPLNLNQYVLCVLVSPSIVKNFAIICEEDGPNSKYYIQAEHGHRDFKKLAELVEHYKNSSFRDDQNLEIRLGQPVARRALAPVAPRKAPAPTKLPVIEPIPEQFEWLQKQESINKPSSTISSKPENKQRNRFKNIFAFDHTRVKLLEANPAIAGDDYINASYIKSGTRKAYIATQGCLAGTRQAFWRMTWQEDVRIIVMVTELVELGKNKCVRYWPKAIKESEIFEACGYRLRVTWIGEKEPTRDYTVRTLLLAYEQLTDAADQYVEVDRRTIYHFQYHAWPDKSVPEHPESILALYTKTHERQVSERATGPIVVHCSAGIGRTGTFIVIGLIIEKLKKNLDADISVMEVVHEVRSQRPGMVQTVAQYNFIYTAILHHKNKFRNPTGEQLYVNYNQKGPDANFYENV